MKKVIFGLAILIFIAGLVAADSFTATVVIEDVPAAVTVTGGQSIVYYLEALNARLLGQAPHVPSIVKSGEKTAEELAQTQSNQEEKSMVPAPTPSGQPVGAAPSGWETPQENKNKTNKVTWADIVDEAQIDFYTVLEGGSKEQLSLGYSPRGKDGVAAINVWVNDKKVDCNKGWKNMWTWSKSLLFGWGEVHEVCQVTYGNRYLLVADLGEKGGMRTIMLESPLIPDACAGKTISQDEDGGDGVLGYSAVAEQC